MGYFDKRINRFNTGSYKYDRVKDTYPKANEESIILTVADMDFKTSKYIIKSFKKLADFGIFGYMTSNTPYFYDSVRYYYKKRFNLEFNKDEIIYSNGAISAIKAIIVNTTIEGDSIAISRPVYGHFTQLIEETNRKVVNIPLLNLNEEYSIGFESLKEKLSDENVKIYILCSPHNPIGRVWAKDELEKIIDICHETNTILVSDEVHCDLISKGNKHHPILEVAKDYKNIVMINGLGKTFNLAGLHASYMIIKDKKLFNNIKINFDCDITPFALEGFKSAYSDKGLKYIEEVNNYIDKNYEFLVNFIRANLPKVKFARREGTYFVYLNFSYLNKTDEELEKLLYEDANVLMQEGIHHDPENGKGYQRICISLPQKELEEALKRILKVIG